MIKKNPSSIKNLELQYVDIPLDQLSKYFAGNHPIIKKNIIHWEFDPEDYLIPDRIIRSSIPIKYDGSISNFQKNINSIVNDLEKSAKKTNPSKTKALYNIKYKLNKFIPIHTHPEYSEFYKQNLNRNELQIVDDYTFDSRDIKMDPEKIEQINKIISKNKGFRMTIIRRDNRDLTGESYEPNVPLSFGLHDNIPRYGKNRMIVTITPKQSFLPTGLYTPGFIKEEEIVLPSDLKYKIVKTLKNEWGGKDYILKILNPHLFVPGMISLNALNNKSYESK